MFNLKGKCALVTGASSGIGKELARRLARRGCRLVLVSRNREKLENLARKLHDELGVDVLVVVKDLSKVGAGKEIYEEITQTGRQIDVLINNAGFGAYGRLVDVEAEKLDSMVRVNVGAVTEMVREFLPGMVKRGKGWVMNVGSTGSFVPCPLHSVYCATKAYVYSFSQALAQEVKGKGVTVTVVCPGVTRTEFAIRASMNKEGKFYSGWGVMDAGEVASVGLDALERGKRAVIPGFFNKCQIFLVRFLPVSMVARTVKRMMRRSR